MDKHFFKFRLLGIGMFLAMIAVFSVAAMFLWNALMPGIFALPRLNYPQTLGLAALFRILLGGIGGWRFDRRGRGFGGPAGDARLFHHGNALREKWMKMSDEERGEFMRARRGFPHFHGFFDEEGRGRCGGGAPAERQSAKADCDGVCQRQTPEEFTGRSFAEQNSDFPPHDKKGDGNE